MVELGAWSSLPTQATKARKASSSLVNRALPLVTSPFRKLKSSLQNWPVASTPEKVLFTHFITAGNDSHKLCPFQEKFSHWHNICTIGGGLVGVTTDEGTVNLKDISKQA